MLKVSVEAKLDGFGARCSVCFQVPPNEFPLVDEFSLVDDDSLTADQVGGGGKIIRFSGGVARGANCLRVRLSPRAVCQESRYPAQLAPVLDPENHGYN